MVPPQNYGISRDECRTTQKMCQDTIINRIDRTEATITARVDKAFESLQRFIDARLEEQGERIAEQGEIVGGMRERLASVATLAESHEKRLDKLSITPPKRENDPPGVDYRAARDTTEVVFTVKGKTALKVASAIIGILVLLAALAGTNVLPFFRAPNPTGVILPVQPTE